MKYVNRDAGSVASRRIRIVALVATFFLFAAGILVSAPSVVSATGSTTTGGGDHPQPDCETKGAGHKTNGTTGSGGGDHHPDKNCDAILQLDKYPNNQHGGTLGSDDFQLLVDGQPQAQHVRFAVTPDVEHVVSEIPQPGYKLRVIKCVDDSTGTWLSHDGTVTVSPGQYVSCKVLNDDIAPTITVHKTVVNDSGGTAGPANFQLTLNGNPLQQDQAYDGIMANQPSVISEDGATPGYAPTSVVCTSDVANSPNNKSVANSGTIDVTPALAENIDCTITNDDTAPGLTVVKAVVNDNGGNEQISDFPLQVNGVTVASGTAFAYAAGVDLAVTETQRAGYRASNITCVSSDPQSANNITTPSPTGTLATVSLSTGESVVCTITNDDIAPTVTVHKTVVGGTKGPADFLMTIAGQPVPQDTAVNTIANTPIEVSEAADPTYVKTSVTCVDKANNQPLTNPLTLNEGQNATCTVTNVFQSPTITVVKAVTNAWGGTVVAANFQLTIDGVGATQAVPHNVAAGAHTVGEVQQPGYTQTGINCVDSDTSAVVGQGGAVTLAAGQHVVCTVSNADIPATLTVMKAVTNDNGGTVNAADFHLQVDNLAVTQGTATQVAAGTHTVTETPVAGYRMLGIVCTIDGTTTVVPYSAGLSLALGQRVTCIVSNDDVPIDLAITKSDNGAVQVAGGPPFDYTITVDNLGSRDPAAGSVITVTDQLPAGFSFVTFPANCTAAGQTLTCLLDPAALQVADPPVVLIVTVAVSPSAPSGTYTNKAYVNIADDLACGGPGCVPICDVSNNNVACEDTDVTRQASLTIDKVDDVIGPISPGATYSYLITVKNAGPSTFLANVTMSDDLPSELTFVSVTADPTWTCSAVGRLVVCHYALDLQPGVAAPVIKITVTLDPNFTGLTVHNIATAQGVVEALGAGGGGIVIGAPGTTVTATDDEDTPIVRFADLVIDKSVSTSVVAAGAQFNWVIDITNHGPDLATDLVVSDTLPAEFEVIGVFPIGGLSCTNTTSTVQCTAASLAVGSTIRAVVQVRVVAAAASGVLTNTAAVSASSTDLNLTDNTDFATITVIASASEAPAPGPSPAITPQLPRTGSPLDGPLTIAALLLGAGSLSVLVARRRRPARA
jgi:uncharacterized repeat protein (TIGR01451 family)